MNSSRPNLHSRHHHKERFYRLREPLTRIQQQEAAAPGRVGFPELPDSKATITCWKFSSLPTTFRAGFESFVRADPSRCSELLHDTHLASCCRRERQSLPRGQLSLQ